LGIGEALLGAAGLVLVVAGGAKVADPSGAVGALGALGVRVGPGLVRAGAVVEAALGALAITVGGAVIAVLVGCSYIGFTAFVVVALVRGTPISSCGCLGRADTPPGIRHVVIDTTAATGAFLTAARGAEPLVDALDSTAGIAWSTGALLAAGAALALLRAPSTASSPR
jgi:hypothetical protein